MTPRRRRPSAAIIIAIVALVVALVSPARAASWLIVSSSQIKPGSISLGNLSARAKASLRGQRGPRGLRGFVGLRGPAGPAGPAGAPGAGGGVTEPSHLAYNAATYVPVPVATATVIGQELPAGSYAITAKGVLSASADLASVTCGLTAGGGETTDRTVMFVTGAVSTPFTMVISYIFASPGRVEMRCSGGVQGADFRLYDLRILAIPVSSQVVAPG